MATDNAGKPKGFAFAFVKEMDQGEAIVKKLNGTELLGRKIKVDVSQGGKKGGKGGKPGQSGGKSNRELQAMREEEEDGKKRRPRRRPKKD